MSHIEYIKRTHRYYGALGYKPYAWAKHADVPFAMPAKPLAKSKLALITTAAPHRPELGDQGPGAAYNAAAKFFKVYTTPFNPAPDLRISHIGYDRVHTSAEDPATWLPISALAKARDNGVVGDVAADIIGIPTNRSQRITVEQYARDAHAQCIRQGADVALFVPT